MPSSPQCRRPRPRFKHDFNCITHSSHIARSCFREPKLSAPVRSSPNQCLVPTAPARAASQADQLRSPFVSGLYAHGSLPIYPRHNGDSWLNYASSFAVHQGCCLWVNVTQDSRYQPEWSDLNDNAAHSYGSHLLFCFTWSGTLPCHDVPYPPVNSFTPSRHLLFCFTWSRTLPRHVPYPPVNSLTPSRHLLFCFTWSGTLLRHDVPCPPVNSFTPLR